MASVRMASPRSPRRRMDATSVKRRRAREEKVPRAGGDGAEKGRAGGKEQKREVSRGRKGRGSRAAPIWNPHHLRVGGKEKKVGEPGIRRRCRLPASSATVNPASRLRGCDRARDFSSATANLASRLRPCSDLLSRLQPPPRFVYV